MVVSPAAMGPGADKRLARETGVAGLRPYIEAAMAVVM